MPNQMQYDVIVVGAGLAGLGAARELTQRGHSVLVLEREATPGGRARTDPWGDARVELGAWYIAPGYRRVMNLIDELGLTDDVRESSPGFPFAIRSGEGWRYTNFFDPRSLAKSVQRKDISSLLKLPGKVALPTLRSLRKLRRFEAADVTTATAYDSTDAASLLRGPLGATLDAFGRMYIGYELNDVGGPFLASLAVDVGRGMMGRGPSFQPSYLRAGTGSLTRAIADKLDVRTGFTVGSVVRGPAGVTIRATDLDGATHEFAAKAAILATTADLAAAMWSDAPPEQRQFLESVRYTQVALLYLRLSRPFVHTSPTGERVGEIVPESERHGKFPGGGLDMDWAAPDGGIWVTGESVCDFRAGLHLQGDDLADHLETQLYELHPSLKDDVVDRRLVEVERYVPVFNKGYATRLAAFRKSLGPNTIDLAGDYLYAPILEGAYASGLAAAERISQLLRRSA